jgi:endonuclease IV
MTEYELGNKFNDAFKQAALGISIGENNQLAEFARLLRTGAQMAEIDLASLYGYTGQGTSAARLGKTEREAFGNLAKSTEVDLSVHAPWSINFSGIDPDPRGKGERSPQYLAQMKNEMKAAINFADDISKSMGRENMPIIFHAASDYYGAPDTKKRIVAYDNDEERAMPIGQVKMEHLDFDSFAKIYGRETFDKLKGIEKGEGITLTPDGKGVLLSPEAAFEFIKDRMRLQMNQQKAEIEMAKSNLDKHEEELVRRLMEANIRGDLAKVREITKNKEAYDDMLKDLKTNELKIDNDIASLDDKENPRLVKFKDKAPILAAEGIKDAAMLSAATQTKPMILIENTMSPEMSLSRPEDVAETVARARDLFVQEQKKRGMSESSARELSRQLIGVNLDIGHLNLFKSYGMTDSEIQKMLTTGKVLDENGRQIFMPNITELIKRYHLNDNMGDIDAHLPLGEGTTPVKEIYETLKNAGVEAPAIMEVFGGAGGIEAGMSQSLQYMGAPIFSDAPYMTLPAYAANPYSSIVGDFSSYSNLGLKQDPFAVGYGGFSGLSPILGGGYMENNKGGGGGFSGAPMN